MIVLDLSGVSPTAAGWRRSCRSARCGWTTLGAPLSGRFNVYIKPAIQKKLSPIARKLPDGRLSMTEGVPFAEGYEAFLTWCGGETVFAGWGGQDDGVLTKNARLWKLPLLEMPEYVDLQASFNRTLGIGTGRRLALENAVAYCGIPEVFEYSQRAARRHVCGAGQRLTAGGGGRAEAGEDVPGAGQIADNAGVSEAGPAADGVLSGPGGCAEQPFGAVRDLPHLPAPGHGELLVSPGEGAVLRHVLLRGARAVSPCVWRWCSGRTASGRGGGRCPR